MKTFKIKIKLKQGKVIRVTFENGKDTDKPKDIINELLQFETLTVNDKYGITRNNISYIMAKERKTKCPK